VLIKFYSVHIHVWNCRLRACSVHQVLLCAYTRVELSPACLQCSSSSTLCIYTCGTVACVPAVLMKFYSVHIYVWNCRLPACSAHQVLLCVHIYLWNCRLLAGSAHQVITRAPLRLSQRLLWSYSIVYSNENPPTFRRNMSPPSFSAYYSTLKMEATCSSETCIDLHWTTRL
jgi:hypothetical protein